MTVFHFARSYNASIAWFPVDQSGPEFIARIGEIECEVECKRQSEAIIDLLGRTESDALSGRIVQRIMEVGLRGRASIHVPDDLDRRILVDGAAWDIPLKSIARPGALNVRPEEHTYELQPRMRTSYTVSCIKTNTYLHTIT